MGFTKLFSSIVTSSLWMEDHPTVRVWIGMLALANANGVVEGSIPGLAHVFRVTRVECEKAIEILSRPDADSRNPENEGRRIEPHPGGWRILNYLNYRDRGQDRDGSRADYYRRYRAQQQNVVCHKKVLGATQIKKADTDKKDSCPFSVNEFEFFYSNYPRKQKRREALEAWKKLKPGPELVKVIMAALDSQKRTEEWKREHGRFIPLPGSWLSGRRWEDEVPEVNPSW